MVAPARSAPGSASHAWCPAAASSRGMAPGRDSTALAVVPAVREKAHMNSNSAQIAFALVMFLREGTVGCRPAS
jgi:hypothetical protein